MPAYQAGRPRVSSTVTKTVGTNPRPRKYATASERQAAYRARAPEVCFRAEPKTVETLDRIAKERDYSRADLLLSMTKFALANHDWARFGLTHKPLPYQYGLKEQEFVGPRLANPAPIWKRKRPKSLGKPVPLTPKQKAAAKAMAKAAGRKYPNLVDNIAASRLENPTMKKPTPAQLAARAKFAEMARSGAFKRKGKKTTTRRKANPDGEKFQVGKYYETRSIGDADMKIGATILARTDKSVTVKGNNDLMKSSYRLTKDYKGNEMFYPWGRYSMAPMIGADDEKPMSNPRKKTVSEKISQLVREGYPQKQAVAVALEEQRAGKVKATPRKRNPAPSIKVGEYVRSYDFPGIRDDTYLEGVLIRKGAGLYTIEVSRRVVEGKEKPIPASLRVVQAPMGPFMLTGVEGVQIVPRPNPATGSKKSRTKLNPVQYRDIAKDVPPARVQYAVHLADRPSYQAMSYFTKKADALEVAQEVADRTGKQIAVSRVQVHFGSM